MSESVFFLSLKKSFSALFIKLLGIISIGSIVMFYILMGPSGIIRSIDVGDNKFVVIPNGSNLQQVAEILEKENVINSSNSFILSTLLSGNKGKLKAGEYAIPINVSPWDLSELIASGKVVIRKLTVIEGVSVHQVIKSIQENPVLKGDITRIPDEGMIMPDTYLYFYGDDRQKMIDTMEKSMTDFLNQQQELIENHSIIKNKKELITLASLVEKETALGAERPIVASVYLNRLRINMPLQCDPTVIYALTQGEKLNRSLTKMDLQVDSPYNTYKVKGLPFGPIGCPGKASILAVLNPKETEALYFVANGVGGHNFANTLDDHNQNVRQWRSLQQEQKEISLKKEEEQTISIQELPKATQSAVNLTDSIEKKTASVKKTKKKALVKKVSGASYKRKKSQSSR